ncbi:BTAD domain-containing putative transcriptional regulator [Streptomyces litchfieldiae]|uniref:BTAD domain-containing putative transcriptional regulator n=1 Tax=Streptomyces litchfieldiae TaxID=3075543 RepID=A0ABU2MMQ8_9ACTN|nr:BTAD domain-containing putative transcriptional regulator [Streptomyces sp. DSM 44938]MDT0342889.1 BTAD domain-containing putative transcriptional regulator [Streptomyces sp. DSM 44938]
MARTPSSGDTRAGRSAGDVLKALLAFVALLALVVGVPLSLASLIGWPLPSSAPSMDMLTEEISADAFLKVLAVLVWVAWAQFTACVLVEAAAAVSGVGLPRRVPGAGPSQLLARQLVGAVLLLTSAAASLTPGLSQLGPGQDGSQSIVSVVSSGPKVSGLPVSSGAHEGSGKAVVDSAPDAVVAVSEEAMLKESAAQATQYYRIQPPEGRHHDTLWGIAERHLGDGLRYKEIFQLNKDRVQPDGSRLTESSLIRPGWILEMPADAQGGELVEMPGDLAELPEEEAGEYEEYRESGDTGWSAPVLPPEQHEQDELPGQPPEPAAPEEDGAAKPLPPRQLNDLPGTPADGAADTGDSVDGGGDGGGDEPPGRALDGGPDEERDTGGPFAPGQDGAAAAEQGGEGASFGLSEALVGAPLLAAGLLMALGRTRRNALWQAAAGTLARGVGDGLGPGTPEAADARDALLVGAAPEAVAFLDRALRALSAALDADGRVLPAVYAAWLGDTALHLQLAAPAGRPPGPWVTGPDETYWTVEKDRLPAADAGVPDAEAPYPGLVSLGTRDGLRLLLNLEALPGIAAVTGAAPLRDAVLASLAAELATSGWSDRMTVTLVGFGEDLIPLAPTRVRHLADVGGLLEVMETETRLRVGALRHAGQDSVLVGRTGPARQQQWAPHLVLIGTPPTETEAERLTTLAAVSARLGIGYVVAADRAGLPGSAWEFEVTRDGVLKEPVMGLELAAQLLPAAQRRAVVELFAGLLRPDGTPNPPVFTVDLSEDRRPDVYVQLMGEFEITGLPMPDTERGQRLREALALLLLHREGVHPRVLGAALWPRGVTDDVRDALVGRLRNWLGADAAGLPRLVVAPDGRLTLSAAVVSDWDVLRTLHHRGIEAGDRLAPEDRRRWLGDALGLARGPLLAGHRYAWLEHEIVDAQYPLLVASIALKLSDELREAGEAQQAYTAVRSALPAAPSDERLWNELLRAAHATGRQEWLSGASEWLLAHHEALFGPGQPLPARTEALLDELLPGWRPVRT